MFDILNHKTDISVRLSDEVEVSDWKIKLLLDTSRPIILIKDNISLFIFSLQFIDLCILLGCDYCESIKGKNICLEK